MSVVSNLLMDANTEAWTATAEEVNIGGKYVHVGKYTYMFNYQLIKYQQYKCSRCVLCKNTSMFKGVYFKL